MKLNDGTTGREVKRTRTERNGLCGVNRTNLMRLSQPLCIFLGHHINIEDSLVVNRVQIYLQSHSKEAMNPSNGFLPYLEKRVSEWSRACQSGRPATLHRIS